MEFRRAYQAMITAIQGGWTAAAAMLGRSKESLENYVYEKKGQTMSVDMALLLQDFSNTKLFAQAVALRSGGVFVEMPSTDHVANDDLLDKFNALHAELGRLSLHFSQHIRDGEIDDIERSDLKRIGTDIHATLEELLALIFRVYCKHTDELRCIPRPNMSAKSKKN